MDKKEIMALISEERGIQVGRYGSQDYNSTELWLAIIQKQVGDVAWKTLSYRLNPGCYHDRDDLQHEIVQVATVALAWIQSHTTYKTVEEMLENIVSVKSFHMTDKEQDNRPSTALGWNAALTFFVGRIAAANIDMNPSSVLDCVAAAFMCAYDMLEAYGTDWYKIE